MSRAPKGFKNPDDYPIPVIQLMRKGLNHKEAFNVISHKLGVKYHTVWAQCVRMLDIRTVDHFASSVENGEIVGILKRKYPESVSLINRELGPLYSQKQ